MPDLNALQILAIGVFLGAFLWYPLGRLSVLLRPRRRRHMRLPPQVPRAGHAGEYVQPGRVAVGDLEVPGQFRRVR